MKIINQGLKFGVVGVGNTLLTLLVIWGMTRYGGCSEMLANLTGYAVGLINSYVWNRQWTFRSQVGWRKSSVRFLGVFAVCYLLQLGLLLLLNQVCPEHPPLYDFCRPLWRFVHIEPLFYNQILAMLFYNIVNFIVNKFYTFKA
ncbi:MAG: GtrA family protein [Tannerella sp.]|jgi:putative flippase GtrA|nr:GtrA family protein [Tannerella sp.]